MAMIMPRAVSGTAVVKFAFGAFTALVLAGCSDSIERFSNNYNNPSDQDPVYTASVPHTYKKKAAIKHWAPAAPADSSDNNDQVTETPITPPYQPKVAANDYANSYKQAYQAPAVAAPAYQAPAVTQPSYQQPKLAYNAVKTPQVPADPTYDNAPPAPQLAAAPKLKVLDDDASTNAPAAVADAAATKVTMKPGMTLYGLARSHHLTVQQLAAANNIKPPYIVPPGRELTIPSSAAAAQATAAQDDQPAQAPAAKPKLKQLAVKKVKADDQIAQSDAAEPITDGDAKTSATPMAKKPAPLALPKEQNATVATSDTPAEANPQLALRWPLHGKIISGFGPKENGLKNEGINIAVPEGTNIQAAEGGVVAYAGNELKGYGNLVLIRHEGGYVTAYAHAAKLLVKKGDIVKRGTIIAVAGQTGAVQSPQLHFEVRKGATALDPQKFLGSSTAMN